MTSNIIIDVKYCSDNVVIYICMYMYNCLAAALLQVDLFGDTVAILNSIVSGSYYGKYVLICFKTPTAAVVDFKLNNMCYCSDNVVIYMYNSLLSGGCTVANGPFLLYGCHFEFCCFR